MNFRMVIPWSSMTLTSTRSLRLTISIFMLTHATLSTFARHPAVRCITVPVLPSTG